LRYIPPAAAFVASSAVLKLLPSKSATYGPFAVDLDMVMDSDIDWIEEETVE